MVKRARAKRACGPNGPGPNGQGPKGLVKLARAKLAGLGYLDTNMDGTVRVKLLCIKGVHDIKS